MPNDQLPKAVVPYRASNILGKRFCRLVVKSYVGSKDGHSIWSCVCDCGNKKNVFGKHLRSSATKSCGCLQREISSSHKKRNHRLYIVWYDMIKRCTNKAFKSYRRYGGRGIRVCPRWMNINNFINDMDGTFEKGLTIDRINNNGGYEPKNCKWSSMAQQSTNKSNTKYFTLHGVTKPLAHWAEERNINKGTFRNRLHRGWSIERALEL